MVFPPDILATLAPLPAWHDEHPLRVRYEVLRASGPYPSERTRRWKLKVRRAQKAALEAYLDAALAHDLLDAEMLGLLRCKDPDGYRAAVAECMTAWHLSAKVGLCVSSKSPGRKGSGSTSGLDADALGTMVRELSDAENSR